MINKIKEYKVSWHECSYIYKLEFDFTLNYKEGRVIFLNNVFVLLKWH